MMRILAFAVALLFTMNAALAEEAIERFASEVTIKADASIAVTETIAIAVEGNQVKRGILRDFPTRYRDPQGNAYEVEFEVLSVRRDGADETFALEDLANGVRIRIGRGDVLLPLGLHTYEIRYRATREVGFFEGFDELYWNVTGNGWTLPILRAEAVIHLPVGAKIVQHAAYTGPQGAKGTDFAVTSGTGTIYRSNTTKRLEPGEGFTVAVGFTKGVLTPPAPPPDTTRQSLMALAAGLGGMLVYYLFAWFRVGRDPKASAIIPLFHAPPELGPAGARFVWKHGFDEKSFAAGVIGLAAKGRFRIENTEKAYRVEKLKKPDGPALTVSEAALLKAHPGGVLAIRESSHTDIHAMREALEGSLKKDYGASTYRSNRGWFWAALPLSLAALVPFMFFARNEDFAAALVIALVFGSLWLLCVWLLFLNMRGFVRSKFIGRVFLAIGFLVLLAILSILTVIPLAWLASARDGVMASYAAGFAALGAMHVAFARWLTAPTVLGQKLMEQIEGLRMYMTAAEENRLNVLNPPEKTPELFERLLPYAIALDCENAWSEKFAAVLAAAAYAGPAWYAGRAFNVNDFGDFTRDLNSSQYDHSARASTSSSSSLPGSFSGSSGGGSSGGGGGGGGGSGW